MRRRGARRDAARPGPERAEDHDAEGTVRQEHRRRLLPGQLDAVGRVPPEAGPRVRPHDGRRDRQDRRRAAREYTAIVTSPENHKRLAQFKEMNRRLALADGLTDDAGAAARPRRQDRRLDRRRPARHRGARRAAADRADLPAEQRDRSGDDADPERRDRAADARQPRRHGARLELVHARARRAPPVDRRRAAAVPEVHRPRQQPRLLHDEPAGEREREPDDVSRVVPGHHVQPPPDRARRRGAVRAAVPRSVQLPLRSADPARHRHWSARRFTRGWRSKGSRAR